MANSSIQESVSPIKVENKDIFLRKGKWTIEEERYANMIINLFNQGMLPIVAGTTLRTYLSDKLRCNPMRITKKYAGDSCIGKQVFQPCEEYSLSIDRIQENQIELQKLENLFLLRINAKSCSSGSLDKIESYSSKYEKSSYESSCNDNMYLENNNNKSIRLASLSFNGIANNKNASSTDCTDHTVETDEDYGYYEEESTDEYGENNYYPENESCNGKECDVNNVNNESYRDDNSESQYPSSEKSSFLSYSTKRVFSAPNLTQLNISRWKETKYNPLPADSLKEIYFQTDSNTGLCLSDKSQHIRSNPRLPDHVYSAIESESGRFNQHSNKRHSNKFTERKRYIHSNDPITVRKRSQSVMSLMELESIASDDKAAGELFMQFLHTINSPMKSNLNSTSLVVGTFPPPPPPPSSSSSSSLICSNNASSHLELHIPDIFSNVDSHSYCNNIKKEPSFESEFMNISNSDK